MVKKQINQIVLHFNIGIALTISSCNWGRTPSKKRFEQNAQIVIPLDTKVLRDEYEDMGSDYAIYYNLQFNVSSLNSFTNSIRHSDYYNKDVGINETINESMYKIVKGEKGVWRKRHYGYQFYKHREDTEYIIDVDTVVKRAQFQELSQ